MTPFFVLVLAGFLARFGYQMARSPVLPRFAQDLGAAPELIGLIVAASTITGVVVKLPAGALSDVLGRKPVMLLGCLFFAGPPFCYSLVDSPGMLLALRFLHGFATAIFSPVAAAFVADLAPRGRGEKLGWFAAANDLGGALGPLVGGLLLFHTASYATTYAVVGLLGLCPLLMVSRLPADPTRPRVGGLLAGRARAFWGGIHEVATNRAVLIAASLEAAMYLGYGAFLGFLPPYAREAGLHDGHIAVVVGVQLATTMLAKPLGGRLSDRFGRKVMILVGLLLCAVTLPLVPTRTSLASLAVVSALFGLGAGIVTPSTTALVADLAKAGRMGTAMGVFGTIWDSGEAAGPVLAGLLIGSVSYVPAFGVISGLMGAMALLFLLTVQDPTAGPGGAPRGPRLRP